MSGRGTRATSSSGRGKGRTRGQGNGWEEQGGYMQAKIQKLQDQFEKDQPSELQYDGGQISNILHGVSIYVNGYTRPTSYELKRLMMQHGGVFCDYYSRDRVTHIIASNLPHSKIVKLTDQKVVKPEWITQSIKAGRLLQYEDFLLYTAKSNIQPALAFKSVDKPAESNVQPALAFKSADKPSKSSETQPKSSTVTSLNQSGIELFDESSEEESTDNLMEINEKDCPIAPYTDNGQVRDKDKMTHHALQSDKPHAVNNDGKTNQMPKKTEYVKHPAEDTFKSPSKAGDPNFLSEYYQNSRLHYLSTWGAEFKAYVKKLQEKGSHFPGRERLKQMATRRCLSPDLQSDETITNCGAFEPRSKVTDGKPERSVMHIDMDCFFVSVGLRSRPDLKGKPVAVTHSRGKGIAKERPGTDLSYEVAQWSKKPGKKPGKPGKTMDALDLERNPDLLMMSDLQADLEVDADTQNLSSVSLKDTFHSMAEIASCSYEARKAGLKNGMFMGKAKALCPDLVTIPYDFAGYRQVSQHLYDIVASFTHDIEAVSCDEMLIDLTDLLADTGATPDEFATLLRSEIFQSTGCTASAGMGPNILMAKMATRTAKPNGQFFLELHKVTDFIKDKSIKDIPGVGWAQTSKLQTMNIYTCGDLQKVALENLKNEFGPKTGQSLYRFCRGIDDRPIRMEKERKSVSAEINYAIRFTKDRDTEKFIQELSEEVHSRMEKINVKGKTITLKLKVRRKDAPTETAKFLGHGICDNITKSVTLPLATDVADVVAKECMGIIRGLKIPATELRGIGIQMSRLESTTGMQGMGAGMQSILNFATKAASKSPEQSDAKHPGPLTTKKTENVGESTNDKEKPSKVEIGKMDFFTTRTFQEPVVIPELRKKDPGQERLLVPQETFSQLPPLPSLPDLVSPEPQERHLQRRPLEVTPKTRGSQSVEDILLPSPSQVDPEVLKELPPDIRQQIEAAMKAKHKTTRHEQQPAQNYHHSSQTTTKPLKKFAVSEAFMQKPGQENSEPESIHTGSEGGARVLEGGEGVQPLPRFVSDHQQPGCSHWRVHTLHQQAVDFLQQCDEDSNEPWKHSDDCENVSEENGNSDTEKGHELNELDSERNIIGVQEKTDTLVETRDGLQVTASEKVDGPIVALPAYSQIDLSCLEALPSDLQEELRQAYLKEQKTDVDTLPTTTASKPPAVHPLMLARSPLKGSPQNSPSKARSPIKRRRGRPKGRKNISPRKVQDVLQRNIVEPKELPTETGDQRDQPEGSVSTVTENVAENSEPQINLCGSVTLPDVKALILEWISSTSDPEGEDMEELLKYLCDLIQDKDLERVDLLLKYIYRCIQRQESSSLPAWQEGYRHIIDYVQNTTQAVYGSKLKLRHE